MRDFKFRAWDHQGKRMFSVDEWGPDYVCADTAVDDDGNVTLWNYDLMQYTGLRDKNGKEIYEGDVVEGKRWDNREVTDVVLFSRGSWWVGHEWAGGKLNLDLLNAMVEANSAEVIGNIYENGDKLAYAEEHGEHSEEK